MPRKLEVRWFAPVAVASLSVWLCGCSLAGTWRTTAVSHDEASFPISSVSFDRTGHFTATSMSSAESRTTVGTYEWDGRVLVLRPDGKAEQRYRGRRGWIGVGDHLVLSAKFEADEVQAELRRVGD